MSPKIPCLTIHRGFNVINHDKLVQLGGVFEHFWLGSKV
jgi:hypothetical protein